MRITATQTLAMTFLLVVLSCPGCKDRSEPQNGPNTPNAGAGPQNGEGEQANNKQAGGEKGEDEAARELPPREEAEKEDEKHPAHTHRDQSFRLVVEATFKDLPDGARVIAPSARDRRYQKVTRSDHSGVPGAVMVAEDGENLFFVSDAIKGKNTEASYKGTFSITRRVGTQGDLATAEGAAWEGDDGKITGTSTVEALTTFASAMGAELGKPHAELHAALAKVQALKRAKDGSSDPAKIVGGEAANTQGVARTLAQVAQLRGVPARLVQGLHHPKVRGATESTHHWVDARLPRLSWVPLDPVLNGDSQAPKGSNAYLGLLPADRVTFVVGNEVILLEDGTFPRTNLAGDLAAPFALLDGKRVGTVNWTATFEENSAPEGK